MNQESPPPDSGPQRTFLEKCWAEATPDGLGPLEGSRVSKPSETSNPPQANRATPERPQPKWGSFLLPNQLPAEWHFEWDERAAIMEFEGGMTRAQAEARALVDILSRMRDAERGRT
jgi:hypothetical protein